MEGIEKKVGMEDPQRVHALWGSSGRATCDRSYRRTEDENRWGNESLPRAGCF